MALENTWVTYLERSYKSIKVSILTRMQTVIPEITDHSESNVFVIIISAFAGLVEQLNYYIDNMAREMYISTARRYSSLVKITRLTDYRIRAKISSTVDLLVTSLDANDIPFNVTSDVIIASGAIVKTADDIEFIITQSRTIFIGNSSVLVPARQGLLVSNSNIGTSSSSANQAFKLDADYCHDTLQISINSITWEQRDTLALSGPSEKHFIVEVNESKEAWVVFGDNINGAIPPTGQSVLATFYKSYGLSGNVEANTIDTWVSGTPVGGGTTSFSVTNLDPAVGGIDVEDLERIRKHAPLSLRTLDRVVTLQDHKDMALLVPGVGKAEVEFDSNLKLIVIYIAPEEGGVATTQLCSDLVSYFATRKMISTYVSAEPCGETLLRIKITATAKFRRSISDTETDIISALLTYFGFNYSDINKPIRKSDIIALVDNLDKVDYLSLDYLTTKPYPRISSGSNPLSSIWWVTVNTTAIAKWQWRLFISNATTREAKLYRIDPITGAENFDSNYNYDLTNPGLADHTSIDGFISIGIYGTFTTGDEWLFTSYPYNEDIEFDDFTIPITSEVELDITVNEQNI
jgi:uncharacterized phage protein gp47/JayE